MDVVDVTERLMAEYEDRLDLGVISGVVNQCRRDLGSAPEQALPELVERLARQRLLEVVAASTGGLPVPRTSGEVRLP